MKLIEIIFSPTGGTQRVTDIIAQQFDLPVEKVDLGREAAENFHIDKDDIAIIAVPSFGGRVPAIAANRLAKIQGNRCRCILICVYGNRAYDDTLLELADLAEKQEFKLIAAVTAVSEHSILRQYASGRPDQDDFSVLAEYGKRISDKTENSEDNDVLPKLPGKRPYQKYGNIPFVPKTGKTCTDCGICAKMCPVQAINPDNPKHTDKKKCIACMRCVSLCPEKARNIHPFWRFIASKMLQNSCSKRKENELFL